MLAVAVAASLAITAAAQVGWNGGSIECPNHPAHDETCGYVQAQAETPCDKGCADNAEGDTVYHAADCAYRPAVEGQPCRHICEVCAPAGKVTPDKAAFDKNEESEGYADVGLACELNADKVEGIMLRTGQTNERGEEILAPLSAETDYAVSAEESRITLKKEYMEKLEEGKHSFVLQFTGAGEQELELTVTDSTAEEAPTESAPEQSAPADSPEAGTDNGMEPSVSEEPTGSAAVQESQESEGNETASPLAEDSYELILKASSIAEEAEHVNVVSGTTGVLSISSSLPAGEKGRYIDVVMPDYGIGLGSPLPTPDGKITKVEKGSKSVDVDGVKNSVQYVRMYIADSVDETVNVQIPYATARISTDIDKKWGEAGTLPATGFTVNVHNGAGEVLATKTCGNWVPENVTENGIRFIVSQNSEISNYDDDINGGKRGVYQVRISYNNPYYQSSYLDYSQTARETVKYVRIYVPDPAQVEVTKVGGSTDFEVQTDGENWWIDYIPKEYVSTYDGGNSTSVQLDKISFNIEMKKAEGYTTQSGQVFDVKPAELVTYRYGLDDEYRYTADWKPKTKTIVQPKKEIEYKGPKVKPKKGDSGGGSLVCICYEPG